jgi:ribulose-phosphate 3-epimerase
MTGKQGRLEEPSLLSFSIGRAYTRSSMKLKIAPSILSADFSRLGDEVRAAEEAGADQIHVDVMDGHFVPNLSMGPIVVEALRRVTTLPLDVHLMITDPEKYAPSFLKAGATHITFHVEVHPDPPRLAAVLRDSGASAGLALNPGTPVSRVLPLVEHFDLLLVMTVNPGFGGQSFLGDNLEKVTAIRKACGRDIDVQVDGGIDSRTAALALHAGANVFVAGNAIFRAPDPRKAVAALRDSLEAASTAATWSQA